MDLEYYIKQNYGPKNELYITRPSKTTTRTSQSRVIPINDYRGYHNSIYDPEGFGGLYDDEPRKDWSVKIVHITHANCWDWEEIKEGTYYKTQLYGYIKVIRINEHRCTFVTDTNPYPSKVDDVITQADYRYESTDKLVYMLHDYTLDEIARINCDC
jgi:hypothetical protein